MEERKSEKRKDGRMKTGGGMQEVRSGEDQGDGSEEGCEEEERLERRS